MARGRAGNRGWKGRISNADRLRFAYVAAIVLGTTGVVVSKFLEVEWVSFVSPVVAMSAYIWFGIAMDRNNRYSVSFADTIYYLGFLFTLIGLLASLSDLSGNAFAVRNFSSNFALALITTVIGVTARALIAGFTPDTAEVSLRAEMSLALTATNLQTQIERLNARLLSIQDHFVGVLDSAGSSFDSEVRSILTRFEGRLTQVASEVLDSTRRRTGELQTEAEGFLATTRSRISELDMTLEKAVASLAQALENASINLAKTQIPPELITESLGPVLNMLAAAIRENADAVAEIGALQTRMKDALRNLAAEMGRAAEAGSVATGESVKLVESLATLTTELVSLADTAKNTSGKLQEDVIKADEELKRLQKTRETIEGELSQTASRSASNP